MEVPQCPVHFFGFVDNRAELIEEPEPIAAGLGQHTGEGTPYLETGTFQLVMALHDLFDPASRCAIGDEMA